MTEQLTPPTAHAIARGFIDDMVQRGLVWSQMRWLMEQMANRCVAESLRRREDEAGLYMRLSQTHTIISDAWSAAAPKYALYGNEEEFDSHDMKKIERARHTLWVRHDPKRAFAEGLTSEHRATIDTEALNFAVTSYLARPYLRHPALDWLFLDMNISAEICGFGESLKQFVLPGKRDPYGLVHSRYFKNHGNLADMTRIDWSEFFHERVVWSLKWIVIPIVVIWSAFSLGGDSAGSWLLGLYGAVIALFVCIKCLGLVIRLVARLAGRADPLVKPFQLWDLMYEVWQRLEGPVVNPSRVRDAMVKSAEQGAVWNTISWSLIDRVIAIDPAVWVVRHPE